MIYKTLASTFAISVALTATSFAQDKSATQTDDGGKVDVQDVKAMGSGSGAGKANFQDLSFAASPSGGEDRLTENLTLRDGGKVNVQDSDIIVSAKDPKIGPIKGESLDKAQVTGFAPFAGAALGAAGPATPACVTESGATDADCNGVPDSSTAIDRRERPKRPQPRQQRR